MNRQRPTRLKVRMRVMNNQRIKIISFIGIDRVYGMYGIEQT